MVAASHSLSVDLPACMVGTALWTAVAATTSWWWSGLACSASVEKHAHGQIPHEVTIAMSRLRAPNMIRAMKPPTENPSALRVVVAQ